MDLTDSVVRNEGSTLDNLGGHLAILNNWLFRYGDCGVIGWMSRRYRGFVSQLRIRRLL